MVFSMVFECLRSVFLWGGACLTFVAWVSILNAPYDKVSRNEHHWLIVKFWLCTFGAL